MVRRNIYTIPANQPFLDCLAEGVLERYGNDPLVLSDVLILLPNRRSCRLMAEAFARVAGDTALMLPQIRPVGETDEELLALDELSLEGEATSIMGNETLDIPPAISRIERQLALIDLIQQWQGHNNHPLYTTKQAGALAYKLAQFLDDVQRAELDMENMRHIVSEELASHWQVTLDFFSIIKDAWPQLLAEKQEMDPVARQVMLVKRLDNIWKIKPPQTPVIIAGTTGSIPSTLQLMKRVNTLPNGMIILPGLDSELGKDEWENMREVHPQFGLKHTLAALQTDENKIILWQEKCPQDVTAPLMRALFSQKTMLDEKGYLFDNFHIVEADSAAEEARVIVLLIRDALEKQSTNVMVVTADRVLANLVHRHMRIYTVQPLNDSAGFPLSDSQEGTLLRLLWKYISERGSLISGMALLKHPLMNMGKTRRDYLYELDKLERFIRKKRIRGDFHNVKRVVDTAQQEAGLLNDFLHITNQLLEHNKNPFSIWCRLQLECMAQLAYLENNDAMQMLERITQSAIFSSFADREVDFNAYVSIMESMLLGKNLRPKYGFHPRVNIVTPLEARLLTADRIILAGMNMGSWPKEQRSEWMSQSMRTEFGLPSLDRFTGLSAHDFVMCASKGNVFITRSIKRDSKVKQPSPWLQRLYVLQQRYGIKQAPLSPWLLYARTLQEPSELISRATRPEPKPDVGIRPQTLSVTEIETWMKDPYSIYAKHVLKVRPLDILDTEQDVQDYGNSIHRIMELFIQSEHWNKPDALNALRKIARDVFNVAYDQALAWSVWWPRFQHMAEWVVERVKLEREGVVKQETEISLSYVFYFHNIYFTLKAKADRVDSFNDDTQRIVDYKTGTPPSNAQVYSGYAPQLSLEALLLWEENEKQTVELLYWMMKGYGNRMKVQGFKAEEIKGLVEHAREGLNSLANAFAKTETPYYATPDAKQALGYPQYDSLARVKEWQNQ